MSVPPIAARGGVTLGLLALLLLGAAAGPVPAEPAPANLDAVRLLSTDLWFATDTIYREARASLGLGPATNKLGALAWQADLFRQRVPRMLDRPGPLREDWSRLAAAYRAALAVVDEDVPDPAAQNFFWVEALMAALAPHFGDTISQADFPPGSRLPPGEIFYTPEGLEDLVLQSSALAGQAFAVVATGGSLSDRRDTTLKLWWRYAKATHDLQRGLADRLGPQEMVRLIHEQDRAWKRAAPLVGELNPTVLQIQTFAMIVTDQVRLRAAFGQLYGPVLWPPAPDGPPSL